MLADDQKEDVRRYNEQVIVGVYRATFETLMAPGFVNHSAPPGAPTGPEGMWDTFQNVLRPALAGLTVMIHDQVGEGDRVTTRKTISGTHSGTLLGIEATGKPVSIDVIDIVRVEDGRYAEHWGINTFPSVLARLKQGGIG